MEQAEKFVENEGGGQFVYIDYKKGVSIKRYRGIGEKAVIPAFIDGKPVIAIERKAFLSCKTLSEITLPDTVEEIGDWAFAHAEKLKKIIIPNHALSSGKELFLGCMRLSSIILNTDEDDIRRQQETGISRMLALAVTVLHDYFLFAPEDVGKDFWIKRWDSKLISFMEIDDLDGFAELWTCGEEDYEGKDYDIKSYTVEKRKMKLRIVYFRLLHLYKISEEVENRLRNYLRGHTKGTTEPEAWDIILEEHGNELEYYKVFADSGCINEDNFDSLLADMPDKNAEIKAYILKYKEEHFSGRDAFAAFELGW